MIAPVLIAAWVLEGDHFLTSRGVKLRGVLLRISLGKESNSVAHLATSFADCGALWQPTGGKSINLQHEIRRRMLPNARVFHGGPGLFRRQRVAFVQ